MYPIPNIINPLPDELFGSFLNCLSETNGMSTAQFLSCYFDAKFNPNHTTKYYSTLAYPICIKELCVSIDYSLESLIQETTLIPALWITQTCEFQDRIIHEAFADNRLLEKTANKHLNQLNYCNFCQQEDLNKYGVAYPHVSHQIPGVRCCYKHNESLLNNNSTVTTADNRYAIFANALQKEWIDADYKKIQEIILDAICFKYSTVNYTELENEMIKEGYDSYFSNSISKVLSTMSPSNSYTKTEHIIALLAFLFPSIDALKDVLASSDINNIATNIFQKGRILNSYKCNKCGSIYFNTQHSEESGYTCPFCSSEDELFESIVSHKNNGQYKIIQDDGPLMSKLKIHCNRCNNDFNTRKRSFIYESVECPCMNQFTGSTMEEMMPEGYELVEFKEKYSDEITVKAKECGHTFPVLYRKFLTSPYCRTCRNKHLQQSGFKDSIKELTGNEYTLQTAYSNRNQKVTILHNNCGKPFDVSPKHFLSGQRCPCCTPQLTIAQYSDYVSKLSSGRYTVLKKDTNNMILLLDNETEKELLLQKQLILQELKRPTSSTILPHKMLTEPVPCLYRSEDILLDYLRKNFDTNDYIKLYRLSIDDMKYSQLKNAIQALIKKGFLNQIKPGTYKFAKRKDE